MAAPPVSEAPNQNKKDKVFGKVNNPNDAFLSIPDRRTRFEPGMENQRKQIMRNNQAIAQRRLQEMKDNKEIIQLPNGQWQKTDKFRPGPSFVTAKQM